MQNEKNDIKSILPEELESMVKGMGESSFRASQIFSWLNKGVESFDEMKNLSSAFRERLNGSCELYAPTLLTEQVSKSDGTAKYLWELRDGNAVETVLMRYKHGNTVCISSQVGCRQGCAFCASTIGGLVRNLTAGEMLDEVLFTQKMCGERISNIVLMGIGEPLDNMDNVMRFLKLVNHDKGLNIGMRHISLSTCGISDRIDELASSNLQLTLSVSLHAPDDETRTKLMPVNRTGGVKELMSACARYYKKTGRRISFEYAMIDGVNDSMEQADKLGEYARGLAAHVNLIPLNHVDEREYRASSIDRVRKFENRLKSAGVNATVRRSLGGDIDASCGQLRKRNAAKSGGGVR